MRLSRSLIDGLKTDLLRDLILLAHWKSQSYWQETYTDLYDFCWCLHNYCVDHGDKAEGELLDLVRAIRNVCLDITAVLDERDEQSAIVASVFAGPAYQYSHGLSVYFPWSEPLSDTPFMEEYKEYKVNQPAKESTETTEADGETLLEQKEFFWHDFLTAYFKETMRKTRKEEAREVPDVTPGQEVNEDVLDAELFEDRANLVYTEEGRLNTAYALAKASPQDLTGDDSVTFSVKNYPHDTRDRRSKAQQAPKEGERAPISPTVSGTNGHRGNDSNGRGAV